MCLRCEFHFLKSIGHLFWNYYFSFNVWLLCHCTNSSNISSLNFNSLIHTLNIWCAWNNFTVRWDIKIQLHFFSQWLVSIYNYISFHFLIVLSKRFFKIFWIEMPSGQSCFVCNTKKTMFNIWLWSTQIFLGFL